MLRGIVLAVRAGSGLAEAQNSSFSHGKAASRTTWCASVPSIPVAEGLKSQSLIFGEHRWLMHGAFPRLAPCRSTIGCSSGATWLMIGRRKSILSGCRCGVPIGPYFPGAAAAIGSCSFPASAAAMTGTVRRKLSGFSEMESMPSATRK